MVEFKDDGVSPALPNGDQWPVLGFAPTGDRCRRGFSRAYGFPFLKASHGPPVTDYVEGLTLRWLWGDVKRFAFILRGAPAGLSERVSSVSQGIKELLGPSRKGRAWKCGARAIHGRRSANWPVAFVNWYTGETPICPNKTAQQRPTRRSGENSTAQMGLIGFSRIDRASRNHRIKERQYFDTRGHERGSLALG